MTNDNIVWWINVARNLNDWEVCDYEDKIKVLASQKVNNSPDQICWLLEKKQCFTVRSYYKFLVEGAAVGFQNFPWKQIWKTKVPPRVAFFAWEACWGKILSLDKLRARGLIIVNGCHLCLNAEESCNHPLLWSPIAQSLVHGLHFVGGKWGCCGLGL